MKTLAKSHVKKINKRLEDKVIAAKYTYYQKGTPHFKAIQKELDDRVTEVCDQ